MNSQGQRKPIKPKVAAAGVGASATTILIVVAAQLGVELPVEVAAAIVTVVSFVSGYLKSDKSEEVSNS